MKWFKSDKGFGFVTLDDGTGDAFLPGRAVEASGYSSMDSGTTLRVRVGQGQKGAQVTEIISVDTSTAEPPRAGGGFQRRERSDFGGGGGGGGGGFAPRGPGETHSGTVRWYNGEKGFGFVQIDQGGGKDVFVHVSVLQRAGLRDLVEGQKVRVTVVQGQKGPQADAIELED
ncbi:cold-shock protein [Alsobacter ponti]|uniref:cold-shock protein n=1 Tax=Alsobacter ponti TaxID=2962936 RepID=UPI003530AD58